MSRAQHLANLEAYRASAEKSRVYFAAKVVELDAAIERERLRLLGNGRRIGTGAP